MVGGGRVVVKHGGDGFGVEAMMLRTLAERSALPVPAVLHDEPDLLILEHIEHDGAAGPGARAPRGRFVRGVARRARPGVRLRDRHADRAAVAALPAHGLVGGVFADQRLAHFGAVARSEGSITESCHDRLRRLAGRLGEVLDEPEHPSLIHGDVWGGNVLCHRGRVAACIDPAIYYAHPEVELAFITLFSTFGAAFFERYHELQPIRDGFFETRRHVYNLYPLLVHAILFGGGYGRQVEATLGRIGA
ncbi:MAG: phosphotransferase [Planctomycetota bacterium]|nr:MAG: phosphotransferase [Planctomycetota bacterium]